MTLPSSAPWFFNRAWHSFPYLFDLTHHPPHFTTLCCWFCFTLYLIFNPLMASNSLLCADVLLRNYSQLTYLRYWDHATKFWVKSVQSTQNSVKIIKAVRFEQMYLYLIGICYVAAPCNMLMNVMPCPACCKQYFCCHIVLFSKTLQNCVYCMQCILLWIYANLCWKQSSCAIHAVVTSYTVSHSASLTTVQSLMPDSSLTRLVFAWQKFSVANYYLKSSIFIYVILL